MVKKRKTKAKAKTKVKARRSAPKRTPKRVAASKPMTKAHEVTLKVVNRILQASENAGAKVIAAEEKLEAAVAKLEKAARTANRKKTAAAKRAVVSGKNAIAKAKANLTGTKAKARDVEKTLKESVKAAEVIRLKDEAKHKAVEAFTAKWERDYERKVAKKTRTTKKKRRRVKKAV